MPFGAGNEKEYIINPNCAIFSLKLEKEGGSYITIAQSVLTTNVDIGKFVGSCVEDIKESISDIELDAFKNPLIITCDNIQVAPNYQIDEYMQLIKNVYPKFFGEYLEKYGTTSNLDKTKVVVGAWFSDALKDFPKIKNTTVPGAMSLLVIISI